MSLNELYPWRKPESLSHALEMLRIATTVGPILLVLKLHPPSLHHPHAKDIQDLALLRRLHEPTPLPVRRKRSLTAPLPPLEASDGVLKMVRRSRQKTDAVQADCLFLNRLPVELRRVVYEEVLCGGAGGRRRRVVHILRKNGRLGHWRCRMQRGHRLCDSEGDRCLGGWLVYKARMRNADRDGRLDLLTDDGLLPLLRTCRMIYSEAIDILYSGNTFHFHDPGDIRFFSRTILPHRLASIRSLMLDWEGNFSIFNPDNRIPKLSKEEDRAWRATWAIISGMQGLRELRITLKKHEFPVPKARRAQMCVPIREFDASALSVFELTVPVDDETDWSILQGVPIRIVKWIPRSISQL
ncbi:hypothetical protein F5884DRAFT_480604 [Xylogone sp. PMI_703]|nr:hypothetical protein F5884DRAFT_480604 [Xylogone sp. PMI_703]